MFSCLVYFDIYLATKKSRKKRKIVSEKSAWLENKTKIFVKMTERLHCSWFSSICAQHSNFAVWQLRKLAAARTELSQRKQAKNLLKGINSAVFQRKPIVWRQYRQANFWEKWWKRFFNFKSTRVSCQNRSQMLHSFAFPVQWMRFALR